LSNGSPKMQKVKNVKPTVLKFCSAILKQYRLFEVSIFVLFVLSRVKILHKFIYNLYANKVSAFRSGPDSLLYIVFELCSMQFNWHLLKKLVLDTIIQ
jgi:hypothetical protein